MQRQQPLVSKSIAAAVKKIKKLSRKRIRKRNKNSVVKKFDNGTDLSYNSLACVECVACLSDVKIS